MITLLIFIAVLAILVLSHEWGHFVVARRSGMRVHEFGFGFPPRLGAIVKIDGRWCLWGPRHDYENAEGTFYSLNLLPLGGFVRIKGESADEADAGDPDSFASKKFLPKVLVLLAGVFMNVALAAVLLSIVFAMGVSEPVTTAEPQFIKEKRVEIVSVTAGEPAARAGLAVGDIVRTIENTNNPSVTQFKEVVAARSPQPVAIVVERAGTLRHFSVAPIIDGETKSPIVGVGIMNMALVRFPWYLAIVEGLRATWQYIHIIVVGLGQFAAGLFKHNSTASGVSGPVGVAVMTGQAARLGLSYLLHFAAILSLNLAVLNVLPIPALDGGRLLFVVINAFKKKPVSPHLEQTIHSVMFVLLILVILVVSFKDVRMLLAGVNNY